MWAVICRPVALCHVATGPGKVDVTTYGASVEVPDNMKGLGLHDRYSSHEVVLKLLATYSCFHSNKT